ncbi:hypothetical protein ACVWXL_000565 [Bradyrhizobium sp. GM22.5]
MDPPRTLRRQCLGWLSSKDILVALQSFLNDSIFSSDGYMSLNVPANGSETQLLSALFNETGRERDLVP